MFFFMNKNAVLLVFQYQEDALRPQLQGFRGGTLSLTDGVRTEEILVSNFGQKIQKLGKIPYIFLFFYFFLFSISFGSLNKMLFSQFSQMRRLVFDQSSIAKKNGKKERKKIRKIPNFFLENQKIQSKIKKKKKILKKNPKNI